METGKQRSALVFICRLLGTLSAATALILTLTTIISFFVVSKNARIVYGTFEQLTIDRVFVVFICLVAALVLFGVARDVDLVATLRWIAVFPAAVGAALGIQFLVILATTALSDWLVQLFNSVALGYAFVAAGAAVAPKHRYRVSLVLGVLLGFYAVFVIATYKFTTWQIVCTIVGLGAALLVVVIQHEKRKFASKPKNDCGS